ncbi:MAG: patatin-like phospholipase family protein [Propionivibrio sp.]
MKRDHLKRAALWLSACALTALLPIPSTAASGGPDDAGTAGYPGKRPKICLVLSGGGARGAAHVGVLKVLEEYRVPIDCIAGTSMGSLVGTAYATGTSVAEMEEINASITTELLFKEDPPRDEMSMRRKQDDYNIFFTPELGVKDGSIHLGKGIVTGVQLETVLRKLSKVKGFHHFDDLPIQLRVVATDLVTGKPVVFDEGELANVMRASMSVPGAVAPAEFGGMMLVDGMLTSNLPVETARAMGADVVIAVNVGTPLLKREHLDGIAGVAGQMLSILTEQNVQASIALLKPTDILITPDLGDFSTADFDHLPRISPLGEEAARAVAERLKPLSLPPEEYAAFRRRQQTVVVPDTQPVDEIRFVNLERVNPKTLEAIMQTEPGKQIDQSKLDSDMRNLYGTGDFEHVNYSFMEEQSRRVLAVDAVEKSWGPDYIRFGLGLSSDFTGDAYFNFLGSYRKKWMNSLGGEWRTDLQVGRTSSLWSEFYQPLTADGRFFVAPHVGIERRTSDIYQDSDRIATYDVLSGGVGAETGMNFGRYGEARLGIVGGFVEPSLSTGPDWLSPERSNVRQGAFTARVVLDQLDSAHFPRHGWRGGIKIYDSTDALGAEDNYTKWSADASAAYSFGEHTLNVGAKAGGRIGSDHLPTYDLFQWGGFMQQSGYATGQLVGENMQYGRVMYYHRILRSSILEGAYGGISYEIGKVGNPLVPGSPDGVLRSGSIFIASDTPVGPAYLGYGFAEDGNRSFYFYLGRPF